MTYAELQVLKAAEEFVTAGSSKNRKALEQAVSALRETSVRRRRFGMATTGA